MITVTYECDDTDQKMITTFDEGDEPGSVEMNITFEPEVNDFTEDPFGIMHRLFEAFKP